MTYDCPLQDEIEDLKSELRNLRSALYQTESDRNGKGDTLTQLTNALYEMIKDLWAEGDETNALRLESLLQSVGLPCHPALFFSVERKVLTPEQLRIWWTEPHKIGAYKRS